MKFAERSESIELEVNRLIRTAYGPFELGDLKPGAVEEVPEHELAPLLETWLPGRSVPTEHTKSTKPAEDGTSEAPWKQGRGRKPSGPPSGSRRRSKTPRPR